jgi:hypothetical protein
MRRLLIALVLGCGLIAMPIRSAEAATAVACVLDGWFFVPGGAPVAAMDTASGGFTVSSLALVCGGSAVLGTGILSASGTFTTGGRFAGSSFSMTVASTTCTGAIAGGFTGAEISFYSRTNCGWPINFVGVAEPWAPAGSVVATAFHFTSVGFVYPSSPECYWVDQSGCAYTADTSSSSAFVISPTQPVVTGATSSWTQIPVVGTGTSAWLGSIVSTPGTPVYLSASPGTSGVVEST